MIKKLALSLPGLVLLVCLLAVPTYNSRWRLPPEPLAPSLLVYPPIKAPHATSIWINVDPIGRGRHCKRECCCLLADDAFRVRLDLEAMRTYKAPPIIRYRITQGRAPDHMRIVRSSGSAKFDQEVMQQIARDPYSPNACGRWLITMQASVEFPDY